MLDNGNWLFTRKGFLTVNKVLHEYALESSDKVLVEDGQRVTKDVALFSHKGKETLASDIAYVALRSGKIYLVSQDQKLEIRNGSEMVIKAGDFVAANQTIATFDPFSEPIIAEYNGYVHYEEIIPGSTLSEELDEETGKIEKRINEFQLDTKQPRIHITDESGNRNNFV